MTVNFDHKFYKVCDLSTDGSGVKYKNFEKNEIT